MTDTRGTAMPIDERSLLVHAYIDGELDPIDSLAVDRQIAGDPALGLEVERIQTLRRVISERLPRETLPPHLMSRIERAIGRTRRPLRPSWQALAASMLLAIALGSGSTWIALHPSSDDHFAEAIVDGHMRALMARQPIDIASSESHTVKPWFNGRIAQSPQVVDLTKDGFPLIGGRIDVINTAPMATLVYGRRLHIISVSAALTGNRSETPSSEHSINGYNIVHWNEGGVTYWATSDLNAAELLTFAQLFQSGLSGHR